MKGRQILLGRAGSREAAALIVDGRLEDLLIDGDAPRPGTIYRARADRPLKGAGGMFLDTPDGSVFLRQARGLRPGEEILVQVTGYAEPGKAIPVTDRLLFKSRYAIATPGAPGVNLSRAIRGEEERARILDATTELSEARHGIILRSSCEGADEDAILDDAQAMLTLAAQVLDDSGRGAEKMLDGDGPHTLAWREWDGFPSEGGLEDWLDAALSAEVPLGGGNSMVIEPTRALVAVDVNTGGDFSPAAGLRANLAAARDLPRQLRVRGLGGQIVVDFAPMTKRDRRLLEDTLKKAFREDTIETSQVGWTTLGLYEMQRKRERLPLPKDIAP